VAEKFDPRNAHKLEDPERLEELPPARIVALLELTGAETVVDFGAGTGMYSLPIADALPSGELLAVEEQQPLADRLREKLTQRVGGGHVRVVQTQGGRAPLPDGAADALFMINVLHHIHDQPEALAEVVRLVRPGGRVAVLEFAQMERPVGPPNDHVLSEAEARAVVARLGLLELSVHQPGEVGRYHLAIVAQKPGA
jgi:ubiquinone/menaquinone biosynthesis C-methylase UbiE